MPVTTQTWRTLTLLFATTTVLAWWQACKAGAALSDEHAARELDHALAAVRAERDRPGDRSPAPAGDDPVRNDTANAPPREMPRVKVPTEVGALAAAFAPLPGENMLAYRDRMLPVAKELLAPQRARVQRNLDDFARRVGLDQSQRDALEQTVRDTADQVRQRVVEAVMNGEVMPPWRPATVVGFARDILDLLDEMAGRFRDSLTPAQRDALDAGRFDPVDYLAFSTHWEELLGAEP